MATIKLYSLNREAHARTPGYWYTVQAAGRTVASFATREAVIGWLEAHGLTLTATLPEPGEFSAQDLVGA